MDSEKTFKQLLNEATTGDAVGWLMFDYELEPEEWQAARAKGLSLIQTFSDARSMRIALNENGGDDEKEKCEELFQQMVDLAADEEEVVEMIEIIISRKTSSTRRGQLRQLVDKLQKLPYFDEPQAT